MDPPFYLERGSLDPAEIDATIKKHLAEIQLCYERELPAKPHLGGKLVVHFVIERTGSVSSASMKSTTMHDDVVERCIGATVMAMRFAIPRGGGTVTVNYPLLFKTTDK